jgi:WD40 repeat protein
MSIGTYQSFTAEQIRALSAIKETLAISAHILIQNPSQLASQLTGRLIDNQTEPVQRLLAGARTRTEPWLRPLTASLEKGGGARYRTLVGHTSAVNSLAISANSKLIFSASSDRTVRVWDINLGSETAILQGFPCGVESLALAPNGEWVFAGLKDGAIQVIEWRTGRLIARLDGHTKAVTAIRCTPDGRCAVSSSTDSTLIIWDLKTFTRHRVLKGHAGAVNDVVITPQGDTAISASSDKTLRLWNLESGREMGKMEAAGEQYALDISPDGRYLLSGSEMVPIAWDLVSLTKIAILTSFYGPYHESSVDGIAITPDGRQFVSASSDWTLKVWKLSDENPLRGDPMTTWATHQAGVLAVVITPNGRWAVSASLDNSIKVWNLGDPETITITSKSTALGNPIKWIGFSPQQEVISLAVGYKLGQFGDDSEWESILRLPEKHLDWNYRVKDITQSSGRKTLLVAVGNGVDAIDISAQASAQEGSFGIWPRLVLSADGTVAAGFNWTKSKLEVWNRETGQSLISVPKMRDIEAIAVTAGNRWVVAGTKDGDLSAWRLSDLQHRHIPKAHADRVNLILADHSGGVVSCGDDGLIYGWNLEGAEIRFSLELSWKKTRDLKLSGDGRRLAAVSDKGAVMIWDLKSGTLLKSLTAGSVKVSGVWNTDIAGKPLSNLVLMNQRDWMLMNNGSRITLMDLLTEEQLTSFTGDTEFETISLSPDESTLVIGTALGEIHKLAIEPAPG